MGTLLPDLERGRRGAASEHQQMTTDTSLFLSNNPASLGTEERCEAKLCHIPLRSTDA